MSEKCKTCDGTGSVPAEVETAEGPMPCPYIGAPCPDCSPMPEKVKVVRESVYRELVEALKALLACPAISDNNLSDPEWGCQESAEAEAKARAALSALTAGKPEQAASSGPIEATDRDALTAALVALTRHGIAPDIQELLLRGNPDLGVRPGALTAAIRATNDRRCVEVDDG